MKIKYLIPSLIGFIAVVVIGIFVIMGGSNSKTVVEKFLKTYYTVENSDLYNLMMNTVTKSEEIVADLKYKYNDYATDKAINQAIANRVILEGEELAVEKDCTISLKSMELTKGVDSLNGDFAYTYVAKILVKYFDNTIKEISLNGYLLMTEDNGKWKVAVFPKKGWSADVA